MRLNRINLAAGAAIALFAAGLVPLGARGGFVGPFTAEAQNLRRSFGKRHAFLI